ncbi:hypothetical protein IV203_006113 [Nitzschia inconspicua]|uniref:Uncharacterized protein n=1 Tax=Nitzschia inconspicua TaxID=303405 RepID=A0A9K3KNQ6_9STRA|nr:hypothetical protein IV203_006113 [Nitzschia inconspicua]
MIESQLEVSESTMSCVEGQPSNPNDDGVVSTVGLRADAPVFVPSWEPVTDDSIDAKSSFQGVVDQRKTKNRMNRNTKQRKIFHCQVEKQSSRQQRDKGQKRNLPRFETSSISPSTASLTGNSKYRNRNRNWNATNGEKKRLERNSCKDSSKTLSHQPQGELSPSNFPALFQATKVEYSTATIWNTAPKIVSSDVVSSSNSMLEALTSCPPDENNPQKSANNWMNGLQSLSIHSVSKSKNGIFVSSSTRSRRSEFGDWDDGDNQKKDLEHDRAEKRIEHDVGSVAVENNQAACLHGQSFPHRPKINMDKLRDRWWEALAEKRREQEFRRELSKALEQYRIEPIEPKEFTPIELSGDSDEFLDGEGSEEDDLEEMIPDATELVFSIKRRPH